jgi:lipoyl(octanoyl) transferase
MVRSVGTARPIVAEWLGRIGYREAWARQKALLELRAAGEIDDRILLLEHAAVLTLGRQADERHILAGPRELARRGIEVIRVERGGEVTYHGPGQLVAYPIVRLADRGMLVRPLVAALEAAMIETCARLGVSAMRRDGHPGCWVEGEPARGRPHRKIGALGLRIERGVTYHGIALNIDADLRDFDLIDPCGMPGLVSTSVAEELGRSAEPPTTAEVERAGGLFAEALGAALESPIEWAAPAGLDGGTPARPASLVEA